MIRRAGKESVRWMGHFFSGIVDFFRSAFWGIHFSIRRKITFDFLTLYVVLTMLSIVVVSILFTYYNVDHLGVEINVNVNKALLAYDRGTYNKQALKKRLDSLSEGSAIELAVDIIGKDSAEQVRTEHFVAGKFPTSLSQRLYYLIVYNYIVKKPYHLNLQSDGVGRNDYVIYQLHSFGRHFRDTAILVLLMMLASGISFFFLSVIGGGRVKAVLSPIEKMTRTAAQISSKNMAERLDVSATKYELRDLAITINDMLDRLSQDYIRQKQFVSDVSHELRTPIAIIGGYGKMVSRWGKTDEKILHEALDAILDEAQNMQGLVENLLTLARSDNQTLTFEYEIFDLSALIRQIAEQARLVDVKKQIIQAETGAELWCNLDMAKIKQVLRIFMDNAIKYTDSGKEVTVFCYTDNRFVYAGVRDQGIGVEKEELPRLFERFYRLDESRARETGGHGLGLAIAKALVIGQGGQIRARSKKGSGSEFAMCFPVERCLIPDGAEKEEPIDV